MNPKKTLSKERRNNRRALTALMVAALALGGAGLAGAMMMNNAAAPADTSAVAPAPSNPGEAASAPPAGSASVPATPQADVVVVPQTCESGTDPSTGAYNACVETYKPNVIQTSAANNYISCWYGGYGYDATTTYQNTTTNQPANATYTAYEGTAVHADATQKSGNSFATDSGWSSCYTPWDYYYQSHYNTGSDAGSRTSAPVSESGLASAGIPAVNGGLSQTNTVDKSTGSGCSSYREGSYWFSGCDNNQGTSTNQDTAAGAGTSAAAANVAQGNDSYSYQDSNNYCGSWGCSSGGYHYGYTSTYTVASASVAPTAVTPGNSYVSGGQANYTSQYCSNYGGCGSYNYRATYVAASTSPVPGALSPHYVWAGQQQVNQGCTMVASVDGVNYLSYVPDGTTCAATAPDVPQAPQVAFPAPGQLPNTGLPLPPLPPVVLPPLPSGLPPLPHP